MNISKKITKIKEKGLIKLIKQLFSRYIYSHWKVYILERPLELKSIEITTTQQPIQVTEYNLHVFEKYFKHYIPSIKKWLKDGSRPDAYIDDNGDVYMMHWINEGGDYYDSSYYKFTIPVPKDSIYQFAGDLSKERRATSLLIQSLQRIWDEYCAQGYKTSRTLVSENNSMSIKVHLRLGYQEVGKLIHVYRFFYFISFHKFEYYSGSKLKRSIKKS